MAVPEGLADVKAGGTPGDRLLEAHASARQALAGLLARLGVPVEGGGDLTLLLLDVLRADLDAGQRLWGHEVAAAESDALARAAAASPGSPLDEDEVRRSLAALRALAQDVARLPGTRGG